ncbi:hypothetical protein LWI29_030278 [Acer saccharum]|uniref:NB-ARC domain-containing protein n=1 Tax=Acer saccharum TaxID=4024 RepID=A0AA39T4M4_ACESA|nr:hypothetical protein LWI29_030278 [Acer saccharum]
MQVFIASGATMFARHPELYVKRLRERYRLSRETARVLKEVERLQKAGNIAAQIVNVNYLAKPVEHIPGTSVENQETASKNLVKVMDLLKDDNIRGIGIWGMGGVGKTTLVKNLNNKLESTSPEYCFGIVMCVTVSKEIAFGGGRWSQYGKALHQRLQHEKRFLLIFDDVWETIDLDCLGVPQPQPEDHTGYMIILPSRSLEVCREMKTDAEVKVDILDDE